MTSYGIQYRVKGKDGVKEDIVHAKDIKSAKKKLGKKNGYKDGRMITIEWSTVIGYY